MPAVPSVGAIFVTIVIEKLGGLVGGLIASMPTTVLVFSVGMSLSARSTAQTQWPNDHEAMRSAAAESLAKAMYTVPVSGRSFSQPASTAHLAVHMLGGFVIAFLWLAVAVNVAHFALTVVLLL